MAQETSAETTGSQQVTVRRSRARRAAARGFEGMERINQICKSIALAGVLAVVGVGLFSRFYVSRFEYLPNDTAMAAGVVADQLRRGNGFTTKVGYALAIDQTVGEGQWRDLIHNPVYPVLLSMFFRVRGGGDSSVALFNGLVHLFTGVFVYLIAVRLRAIYTGVLAVILYFVSMAAIETALNGTGITVVAFLVTLGVWTALKCIDAQNAEEPSFAAAYLWPAAVGVVFGLAYLAGGLTVLVVLPAAALVAYGGNRSRRNWIVIIGAFVLTLLPWVARNWMVSGTISPLFVNYKLLAFTESYPGEPVHQRLPGTVEAPLSFVLSHPAQMGKKMVEGLVKLYRRVPSLLNPYIFPFFLLLGFWGRAGDNDARRVWKVVIAMLALQVVAAALYEHEAEPMRAFLPVALCLGTVGAVIIVGEKLSSRAGRVGAAIGLLALAGLPYGASLLLGRKVSSSYSMANLSQMQNYITGDALIATDAPAAVTWYTGKRTVMLPMGIDGFERLLERGVDPDYVYFTRKFTRNHPRTEWMEILTGHLDTEKKRLLGQLINYPLGTGEFLLQRHRKLSEGVQLKRSFQGERKEQEEADAERP